MKQREYMKHEETQSKTEGICETQGNRVKQREYVKHEETSCKTG